MKIAILRDDTSFGPYTMKQVKAMMAQGRLTRTDRASADGGANWELLENLIIQDAIRRQRKALVATRNAAPKKTGGKHARRWLWKPE